MCICTYLIENAKINRGRSKKYIGVAGNLFAHACKWSFELGFGGFVAFDSKTKLIRHYIKTLEATFVGAQRLHLDEEVAKNLFFGILEDMKHNDKKRLPEPDDVPYSVISTADTPESRALTSDWIKARKKQIVKAERGRR